MVQAMFSSIQKHFLRCKMLVGEAPQTPCSAFSNAGCASRVALLAEGVERNTAKFAEKIPDIGRPPCGGRG